MINCQSKVFTGCGISEVLILIVLPLPTGARAVLTLTYDQTPYPNPNLQEPKQSQAANPYMQNVTKLLNDKVILSIDRGSLTPSLSTPVTLLQYLASPVSPVPGIAWHPTLMLVPPQVSPPLDALADTEIMNQVPEARDRNLGKLMQDAKIEVLKKIFDKVDGRHGHCTLLTWLPVQGLISCTSP